MSRRRREAADGDSEPVANPHLEPVKLGAATAAAVFVPRLGRHEDLLRPPQARLDEAIGLARAIALDVRLAEIVQVGTVKPNTYIGSGVVERLGGAIAVHGVTVAIFDCRLSPVQQRNLETALKCKVIDRTGLILEIFGARAHTHEGRLQVELAALNYQRSRLVRSWTHLERQRGGFGFLGGPGESQLEMDRRLIGERVKRLRGDLERVRRTRALQRKGRRRNAIPVVALVGYTNAGKSTLFNTLTRADVVAKDLLFATLDPTIRALRLPSGRRAVLSDTVGFISDLPTDLVAAFRATLEEVIEADLIIHVRDISHAQSAQQKLDVESVLADLGLGEDGQPGAMIEALNKIDRLAPNQRKQVRLACGENQFPISALDGEGVAGLMAAIERRLSGNAATLWIRTDPGNGAGIAWLYRNASVLERSDKGETSRFKIVALEGMRERLAARADFKLETGAKKAAITRGRTKKNAAKKPKKPARAAH